MACATVIQDRVVVKADGGRKAGAPSAPSSPPKSGIVVPTLLQQGPACKPPRVAIKDCPADDHEGTFRRQKSRRTGSMQPLPCPLAVN
jgi:hypothetical protein